MYKNILTTGAMNNHNVSVSGGNDRIRFRMSAGYSHENGPLDTNKDTYTRKNISAFVSADVNKWFTQEASLLYTDADKKRPQAVGNMMGFYTTRLVSYYPEGDIPGSILGIDEDLPSQTPGNMLRLAPVSYENTAVTRVSTRSILKPLKDWTITAEYTFDKKDVDLHFYSDRFRFADTQLAAKWSVEQGQDYYQMQDTQKRYNALNIFSNYEHHWVSIRSKQWQASTKKVIITRASTDR